MTIVAFISFVGSAGLLFGTSNILPNSGTHGRRKRLMMQALISATVLAAALFIFLTQGFDQGAKRWASASMGMVVGYWLKAR
jgi:hypothetical protein